MNLTPVINKLRDELERVNRTITTLEQLSIIGLAPGKRIPGRRGRKSMGPAERIEVSNRMKRYWATVRRKGEAIK